MKIAITGATGIVGRFIAEAAFRAGHAVTTLGRQPLRLGAERFAFQPWRLGQSPDLQGQDALIHAGFLHAPGKYRGGEVDDPQGFRDANLEGSLHLFDTARRQGVRRALFLSSRAVFDAYPTGTLLSEDLPPAPDSLYGEVKLAVEHGLAAMATAAFQTVSLRSTGVYGQPPGLTEHKWSPLFAAFRAGDPITRRIATEVHGDDLARAVLTLLHAMEERPSHRSGATSRDGRDADPIAQGAVGLSPSLDHDHRGGNATPTTSPASPVPHAVHVSDIILDNRDLLSRYAAAAKLPSSALPSGQTPEEPSVLETRTLQELGWSGGGIDRLQQTVEAIVLSEASEPQS